MRIETNFKMEVNLGTYTSTGNLFNPKELDSIRLDRTFCYCGPHGPGSRAEILLSKPAIDLKMGRNAIRLTRKQIIYSSLNVMILQSAGCIWLKNDIIGANSK